MLSEAALQKHKQSFDSSKHEAKMSRVQSYVMDQQEHLHQYKSPNSSSADSVPESCKNQGSLCSITLSVSISELIKRKQRLAHKPSPSEALTRRPYKQTLIDSYTQKTSCGNEQRSSFTGDRRDTKRHKSSSMSKSPEKTSPQPKPSIIKKAAHGMHLLQKFVSPNLEMSRITMKSNIKQPKLGLFRKGKSSALGKPVADLTNFNDKFSVTPKECARSSCLEELSKDPPSISKFFQRKPNKTAASILSNKTDHSTPRSKAAQSKNRSSEEPHRKRKRSTSSLDQYEAFTNTSFDTIYQLLKECHELNQLTPSKHHGIPNYSHVRTPDSPLQQSSDTARRNNTMHATGNLSFMSSNSLPHPFSIQQPNLPSLSPPHCNDQMNKKQQPPPYRQDIFTPSWQVTESVVSFSARTATEEYELLGREKADDEEEDRTTVANDDLDIILHSRAMNILGECIQQNEKNIQNFWLSQPGFKRGV